MISLRKFSPFVAAVVSIALFAIPSPVHAGVIAVRVYDDGVLQSIGFVSDTTALVYGLPFAGTTTHFTISGSGSSNNPGTSGGSTLSLGSNATIATSFGTSGGTHTLRIEVSQSDFTLPIGDPLFLTSSAGGSFTYLTGTSLGVTESVAASYRGFVDNGNVLFDQATGTAATTAAASSTFTGTTTLVYSPTKQFAMVPGATPFSITDVLEFTFTLAAGSGNAVANTSASTVVTSDRPDDFADPAPAPAGIVLAMAGMPVLAMGGWLRRRRVVAV